MPKKKKSLVDSFVFRKAKESVDSLSQDSKTKDPHEKKKAPGPAADIPPAGKKPNKIPFPAKTAAPNESKKRAHLYTDTVAQLPSDIDTSPKTKPVTHIDIDIDTNPPTQLSSDLYGDPVTQRSSDIDTDTVTQLYSDIDSEAILYIDNETYKDFAVVNMAKKPGDLSLRQYCTLHFIYFNRPFKVVANHGLGMILNMGSNNAKYQLFSLYKKGYIFKPYSINDGKHKGSTCRIVEQKCFPLFGSTNVTNPPEIPEQLRNRVTYILTQRHSDSHTNTVGQLYSDLNTNTVAHRSSDLDINQPNASNSSSRILDNTTTLENCNAHPEFQYWNQKGVTNKQVATWMKEAGIKSEIDMNLFLAWSAYDLRQANGNDHETQKSINNPPAWFRKILIKNSAYPKPKNYESFEEAELRKEKEQRDRIKQIAEEKRRIREEKIKAEIDLDFEKMMEGQGDRFTECESKLNDFAKKRRNTRTYTDSMRAKFKELYY